jgi:hypothetical protein
MLSHTLKSVVKSFKNYADDKKISFTAKDINSQRLYCFNIDKDSVLVDINSGELSSRQAIEDVEMFSLPSHFKVLQVIERTYTPDGAIFEEQTANVSYEAQLFLKLFRMMKERVFFRFMHDGAMHDCYFIDGKVFYIEETDDEYKLMGTNLFRLPVTHKDYRIISIESIMDVLDYKSFVEKHERAAKLLGKQFFKYKFGQRV